MYPHFSRFSRSSGNPETSGDDSEIGIEMKMVTDIFGGGSSKGTNGDNERTGLKQNVNEYFKPYFSLLF